MWSPGSNGVKATGTSVFLAGWCRDPVRQYRVSAPACEVVEGVAGKETRIIHDAGCKATPANAAGERVAFSCHPYPATLCSHADLYRTGFVISCHTLNEAINSVLFSLLLSDILSFALVNIHNNCVRERLPYYRKHEIYIQLSIYLSQNGILKSDYYLR